MYRNLMFAGDLLINTIQRFGMNKQKRKAEEELLELAIELKRDQDGRDHNVEEEIADVIIMVEQLKIMYDGAKISEFVAAKLERLERRINNDTEQQSK